MPVFRSGLNQAPVNKERIEPGMLIFATIFVVIFLSRLPGLIQPYGLRYNPDELEMTLSIVDRYLGLPSTSLAWPGSTVQMVGMPVVGLSFIVDNPGSFSQDAIVSHFGGIYRDPYNLMNAMRFVIAIISSLGFACLYFPLLQLTNKQIAAIVGVSVVSFNSQVWLHSHMAVSDALALAIGCFVLYTFYLSAHESKWLWIGFFLIGCMLSTRVTFIFLVPFILSYGLMNKRNELSLVRWLILGGIIAVFGLVFSNPYIWIDPIRFLKSVIGNAQRSGDTGGFSNAITQLFEIMTWPVIILSIIGAFVATRRSLVLVSGAILTVLMIVIVYSRAGVVFGRYFIPMIVPLAFLIGYFVSHISEYIERRVGHSSYLRWMPTVFLLVSIAGLPSYVNDVQSARNEARDRQSMWEYLKEYSQDTESVRLIIPDDLFGVFSQQASPESLIRLRDAVPLYSSEALATFSGLDPDLSNLLQNALNEDEQVLRARLNAMSLSPNDSFYDAAIYVDDTEALRGKRMGYLLWDDAVERFRLCEANMLIVVREQLLADLPQDIGEFHQEDFGEFHILVKDCD